MAGAVVAVSSLMASKLHAGLPITGSKHDFKTTAYVGEGGLVMKAAYNKCGTCHAAHKAKRVRPLWSRDNPTDTGWIVWDGGAGRALDATTTGGYLTAADFVASGSGLCMSCHDGVTAIGSTSAAEPVYMASAFEGTWGRNLYDMHPVGKVVPFGSTGWQASLAAGNTASGSTVVTETSDTVGCTSCHTMHSGSATSGMILRSGERCLSCHNK